MTFTGTFPLGKRTTYAAIFRSPNSYRGTPALAGTVICTYAIVSAATGKAYVGSTENLFRRWSGHVISLRGGTHTNAGLQELHDMLGLEDLSIRILAHYDSTDDLLAHEYADGLQHFALDDLLNVRLGNKFLNGLSAKTLARSAKSQADAAAWHSIQGPLVSRTGDAVIRTQPYVTVDREAIIDVLSDGLREIMADCDRFVEHVQLLGLDRQSQSHILSNLLLIGAKANEHLSQASTIVRNHVNGST